MGLQLPLVCEARFLGQEGIRYILLVRNPYATVVPDMSDRPSRYVWLTPKTDLNGWYPRHGSNRQRVMLT